jgi:hypothetical protein
VVDARGGSNGTCGEEETFGGESVRERDHLEEKGVDGRAGVKRVLKKREVKLWA